MVKTFSPRVTAQPTSFTGFLMGLDFAQGPSHEVVIAGKRGSPDTERMLDALRDRFLPRAVILFRADDIELKGIADFARAMSPVENRATAYVCQDFRCGLPVTDVNEMIATLEGGEGPR
jgi:uncharacterized protein YyaL (SSP411 family)